MDDHVGAARCIERCIGRAGDLAILIGAGASAECGVPTFRGAGGLWRSFRPEELATPGAFAADPQLVWEWYDWRRGLIGACEPGAVHHAIRDLEQKLEAGGGRFTLLSQNVDGLHARAGVKSHLDIHGCIWMLRCTACGARRWNEDVPLDPLPPLCPQCQALERPDVIWFGEGLDPQVLSDAWDAARRCDTFLVVGTSAVVEPAASLARVAAQEGAALVEINPEDTPLSHLADFTLRGSAGDILPALL